LNLEVLENFEKAKKTFREKSKTPHCAQMIADYCNRKGAKKDSIEFLILAGSKAEAFKIATDHEEMDEYARVILTTDEKNFDEHSNIAAYFE
jgi:WD repeat-containing protein 19